MKFLDKVIEFATKAHEGQKRKLQALDYIAHPFSVAMILSQSGCSEEIIAGGLLHDTLEDTNVTAEDIQKAFGDNVLKIVLGATELPQSTHNWEERKKASIEKTKTVSEGSKWVILADKIQNLRSLLVQYENQGEEVWNGFKRGKDKQEWYYRSILNSIVENSENIKNPKFKELILEYEDLLNKIFKVK